MWKEMCLVESLDIQAKPSPMVRSISSCSAIHCTFDSMISSGTSFYQELIVASTFTQCL